MEAPPQYGNYSYPPPKKKKTGLIIGLVVGALFLCCGGSLLGLFGLFNLANKAMPIAGCAINYQLVHVALGKYAAAHNGKLPKAETWQDDLRPYFSVDKSLQDFKKNPLLKSLKPMDADGEWGCSENDVIATGMAFNTKYSGKKLSEIQDLQAVVVFEIEKPSRNAHRPYKALDPMTSPMLFNSHRGWMLMDTNGMTYLNGPRGIQPVSNHGSFGSDQDLSGGVSVSPDKGDNKSGK